MFCYRDYQLTSRLNQQNEKSTSNKKDLSYWKIAPLHVSRGIPMTSWQYGHQLQFDSWSVENCHFSSRGLVPIQNLIQWFLTHLSMKIWWFGSKKNKYYLQYWREWHNCMYWGESLWHHYWEPLHISGFSGNYDFYSRQYRPCDINIPVISTQNRHGKKNRNPRARVYINRPVSPSSHWPM